jgi:uncharacterized protein YbjT (DUF2867 family)
MAKKTALVTRATGVQGKAAIAHLVNSGWTVRALVSDTSSDRAVDLKSFGEQVILQQGTWRDLSTIEAVIKGCHALVFVQLPSFTDDAELQEAHVVLNLAKDAGVEHVVFPSSLVLNNPNAAEELKGLSAAPAVLNKADVEELVKSSGLTWTLLRPGYFLTNLLPPLVYWMYPDMRDGRLVNSYGPDCVLTLVDPDDIGAFVAAALNDPNKFGGKTITVVSENMRFANMIEKFSEACGRQIEVVYRTPEETEKEIASPFVSGQVLCKGLDKLVDMENIKNWGIPLTSFDQFLEKHKHELPRGRNSEKDSSIVPFSDSQMTANT